MNIKRGTQVLALLFSGLALTSAQQDIKVDVYPQTSRAIEGHLNLNRTKYFNLSASGTNIEGIIGDQARTDYYFKDLKMTLGRALGMVGSEVQWGNSVFEDPNRPGYTDIDLLISKQNPSNAGASAEFMNILGDNQNVANHDRHNSYPEFMDLYTAEGSDQSYPGNTDAAAELAATLLEYKYTDWTRPAFFEPVNEPDWRYWSDSRFIEHHTSIHTKVHDAGLPLEVGGPCLSVGYFYKNHFQALSQITGFMDRSMMSLDFYSYHIYNFMHWDEEKFDFAGSISTGLPTEGVFDAIANHALNKFGKAFTYVGSEHGGYISDGSEEEVSSMLADKYFPGSGFEHTMEKRSIEDYLAVSSSLANTMTFMNNPHIVKKAVPFILLESAGWDPTYNAVLLVKEDFDKTKDWVESKRIHFYEFFKDVEGRRILSFCEDNDIQHHAFVEDNRLILIFNNQANVEGSIDLQIHDVEGEIKEIRARKYGRNIDFRPYLTEERLFSLEDSIPLRAREAMVITIEYDRPIAQDHTLNEIPHYGNGTSVEFSGSHDFIVEMPNFENAEYALLRVGIGLGSLSSKNVNFAINGTAFESVVEDCADRLSGGSDYGSTRIMRVDTSLLQATNTITVTFPDGQTGGVGATVIRAGYLSSEPIEGLELQKSSVSLYENQSTSVPLTFFSETTNDHDVTWESLDEAIASVTPEGQITGESEGSTRIVVHAVNGGFTDTCSVSVSTQELVSMADKSGWIAVWADDEGYNNGEEKDMAIDNNPATMWHTQWKEPPVKPLPHEIWVDMADTLTFDRFLYTPRQDPWGPNGNIGEYELYFSNDSADWGTAAVTGEFAWNIGEADYYKEIQQIDLGGPVSARFFRLVALTEHQNNPEQTASNAAELDVASDMTGLTLGQDTVSISVGESLVLDIFTLPFSGKIQGNQVNWLSLDQTVASVSDGEIRGTGPGETMIIATSFDGSYSDTCIVNTAIIPVEKLIISSQELEMNVGETVILSASITPENAYFDSFSWSSDNEAVAWVDRAYVTAEFPGTSNIIVTSSDGIHKDTCVLTVTDMQFQVKITVLDNFSGLPLQGAIVELGDENMESDVAGVALFSAFPQGDYTLRVSKELYQTQSPGLSFPADTLFTTMLKRNQHSVDVQVRELILGIPVYNADVLVGTESRKTNTEGIAPFTLAWGDYDYLLSKSYFEPYGGTLSISSDSLAELRLERLMADLKFKVSDENGILAGASILFNEQSGETNSVGVYTFTAQEVNKEYSYEVSRQGYETISDVVLLQKDSTLNLLLTEATDIADGSLANVSFYPNPVDALLYLKADSKTLFQLVSMEGTVLKELKMKAGDYKVPMSEYPSGIYLIRFSNENEVKIKAISVIH